VVHLDAARLPAEPEQNPQPPAECGSAEPDPAIASPAGPPAARIAGGPGLPDATVHRLLCSGRIRTVITTHHPSDATDAGGEQRRYRWRKGVLDVGANRRLVSDKTFRALLVRDNGACTVPGCGSTHGLEAHHVRYWYWGGKTVMANLVLLCRAHHHAVHADELSIQPLGNQRFRYCRGDGSELPQHVEAGDFASGPPLEDEFDSVEPGAATTRWDGSRLDRHFAVAVLADRVDRAGRRREAGRPSLRAIPFEEWLAPSTQEPLTA
jgi:5-methylcytosine-specific restriction endonuclease McrA